MHVSRLWSQEIVGTDAELGIKKDLAGQKGIWPLDVQVDDHGKVITILVATFCKDRISSSSYM
jgi:nuclear pore complex protein Nup133